MEFMNKRENIPVVIGRYFNAIGKKETNPHLFPDIIEQLSKNKGILKLGNIFPRRDYIHAADLANATAELMFSKKTDKGVNIVNIGSGKEYSVKDIVDLFGKELGQKICLRTDKKKTRKMDRPHLCADISNLRKKFFWNPKYSIEDTIKELSELL